MKHIFLASFLVVLASCLPEGRVYEKHQQLSPEIQWIRADARTFEVPIEDNAIPYDFKVALRFVNGYPYELAKVKVVETSPSGKTSENEYDLVLRDSKGDYIGDPGYDIWDSEHLVEPKKTFEEKGTYSYEITHAMPQDTLNLVMEIGVVVDNIK